MPGMKRLWSDKQVEKILGNLLRSGVVAAALVVLAGGIIYLIRYGAISRLFHLPRSTTEFRSVGGIITAALRSGARLINLGYFC